MDQARPGCDWFKNLSNGVGPSFRTTGCHHASDRNDRSHAVYRALSTNGESALACRTSSNSRLSNPPVPAKFLSSVTAPRARSNAVYASLCTSRYPVQDSGPSRSLVLSRKNFPFSASSRFSPAHKYPHYTQSARNRILSLLTAAVEVKRPGIRPLTSGCRGQVAVCARYPPKIHDGTGTLRCRNLPWDVSKQHVVRLRQRATQMQK